MVLVAKFAFDEGLGLLQSRCCEVSGVGSHVGDEADRFAVAKDDALVEALRGAHGAGCIEPQGPRGLLLESAGDEWGPRANFDLPFDDARHGV